MNDQSTKINNLLSMANKNCSDLEENFNRLRDFVVFAEYIGDTPNFSTIKFSIIPEFSAIFDKFQNIFKNNNELMLRTCRLANDFRCWSIGVSDEAEQLNNLTKQPEE